MYRRVSSFIAASSAASLVGQQTRNYQLFPHIDEEIEELRDVQRDKRWHAGAINNYATVEGAAEHQVNAINYRESRRRGTRGEKSIARTLSNVYTEDGTPFQQPDAYAIPEITITVIGFDGHPFYLKVRPFNGWSVNHIINESGMCHGWGHLFQACEVGEEFSEHNAGCMVNVDIDTLYKLPAPSRAEYYALVRSRVESRPDVKFNTRFSCCLFLEKEMDGAVVAMKQVASNNALKADAQGGWSQVDNYATISLKGSRRIEPWAPMLEEPTKAGFPVTFESIWADTYEDVMKQKYPQYKRLDGGSIKPRLWSQFN